MRKMTGKKSLMFRSVAAVLSALLIVTSVPTEFAAEELPDQGMTVQEEETPASDNSSVEPEAEPSEGAVPEEVTAPADAAEEADPSKEDVSDASPSVKISHTGNGNDDPEGVITDNPETEEKAEETAGETEKAEEKDEREYPEFTPDIVEFDDIKVGVSAPEGAFPEGAALTVDKASDADNEKAETAIDEIRDEELSVAKAYTFDIKVFDEDGETELQPADDRKVRLVLDLPEVADENLETKVYHVKENKETGELSAEELELLPEETIEEIMEEIKGSGDNAGEDTEQTVEENRNETTEENKEEKTEEDEDEVKTVLAVETDGFSFYTVEFTYKKLEYILQRGKPVSLSEMTDEGFVGDTETVEVSDDSLLLASDESGEWMITAHDFFDTEEFVKFTINEIEYEISVTCEDFPAFEPEAVEIDGVKISVSAPEGVFPAGATLSVRKVSAEEQERADAAIDKVFDTDKNVGLAYTFDIKVLAEDGETELEPADSSMVTVTFDAAQVADPNLDTQVYHVAEDEDTGSLHAEELVVRTDSAEDTTAAVETDGFSYYSVRFTYGIYNYVLRDRTITGWVVPLDNILTAFRLSGTVTSVVSSNTDLIGIAGGGPVDPTNIRVVVTDYFESTNEYITVTINNTPINIGITCPLNVMGAGDWSTLQDYASGGDDITSDDVYIKLTKNITCPSGGDRIKVKGGITPAMTTRKVFIDLNGKKLSRGLSSKKSDGHVIEVMEGAVLIIKDSSADGTGIITGGYSDYGGGIYINEGSSVTIEGGKIYDNHANKQGGGIYVDGTLTMTGGTISSNHSNSQGGGIYVSSDAWIDLKNTTIFDNHAEKNGGGIYYNSDRIKTYDPSIADCSIDSNGAGGYGGGIYMDAKGHSVKILDTKIDNNEAKKDGGGIYINNGAINMTGTTAEKCTLKTNIATNNSGGVEATSGTTFHATRVTISNNQANKGQGAGVRNLGTATLTSCIVTDNIAKGNGGGIYNDNDLTLTKCTISGNSANGYGGGVYSDEKLSITGGTVTGNMSNERGNGICLDSSSEATKIKGYIVVKDNQHMITNDEVYMAGGDTNQLDPTGGPLSDTVEGQVRKSEIGISLKAGTGMFTIPYSSTEGWVEPKECFFSLEGFTVKESNLTANKHYLMLVSGWSSLQYEINQAAKPIASGETGGTVTLDRDYMAGPNDAMLEIPDLYTVTIDLNGHTIDRNRSLVETGGSVIKAGLGSTLTIKDSSAQNGEAGTGKITGGYTIFGGGILVEGGSLRMENVNIVDNRAKLGGAGIYLDGGSLDITGGSITGNTVTDGDLLLPLGYGGGIYVNKATGDFKLSAVSISNNHAQKAGGGIYLKEAGNDSNYDFNIRNCKIERNEAGALGGGGISMEKCGGVSLGIAYTRIDNNVSKGGAGGISIQNGTVSAYETSISGNSCSGEGGGIGNYGNITLKGCNINQNQAGEEGGGAYNSSKNDSPGKLKLEDCVVAGNKSDSFGGGIYSEKNLTIDGGTIGAFVSPNASISGNDSAAKGGGIYIDEGATTNIKGEIVVKGNTATSRGPEIYMREGNHLTLDGKLKNDIRTEDGSKKIPQIGITMEREIGTFTVNYCDKNGGSINPSNPAEPTDPNDFFFSPEGYEIKVTALNKEAALDTGWAQLRSALAFAIHHGKHEFVLDKDYTAGPSDRELLIPGTPSDPGSFPITLDLNGHTLNRNIWDVSLADLMNGATATGVIVLSEGAKLTIKDSSAQNGKPGTGTITKGWAKEGGGINVGKNSNLHFEGGTVTDNKATKGGGIYVDEEGSLYLRGGTISSNTASSDGGGICVSENGYMESSNNSTISLNTATKKGGGIHVDSGAQISLGNTTIRNNKAGDPGGGINFEGWNSDIRDCTIIENFSESHGGGIRLNTEKTLKINDTVIDDNQSSDNGGGIYIKKGMVKMTGGSISGNSAANNGGGVKICSDTSFTATGVSFFGNTAAGEDGGGIKNTGVAELTSCDISGNSSKNEGGGITNRQYDDVTDSGILTLTNCTISDNTSLTNGGGLYSDHKITISGGEITGNRASINGGGFYVGSASKDTSISGNLIVDKNTADAFGNNVYIVNGEKLNAGKLGSKTKIGVDLQSGVGVFTTGYQNNNKSGGSTVNPAKYFYSATGLDIGLQSGEAVILSNWQELKDLVEKGTATKEITLTRDYAAGPSDDVIRIESGRDIKIDLNGHTVNRNRMSQDSDGHVFYVKEGVLTVLDSSAKNGKAGTGTIMGGWAEYYGGGINIDNDGTLKLLGGTITGNRAGRDGGGIYVFGKLVMSGGTVKDNSAIDSGGGIGIHDGSTFDLETDTSRYYNSLITENLARNYGGGIYVSEGARFTLKGSPVVSKNTAVKTGNGVYLKNVKIEMAGALTDGAEIGVAIKDEKGIFTNGYGRYNIDDPSRYFSSTEGFMVVGESREAKLTTDTFGKTDYEDPFIEWNDQIKYHEDAVSNANWMSGISGERYLNEINIPGSHDSGMCTTKYIRWRTDMTAIGTYLFPDLLRRMATTQTHYIDTQLAQGARFLDLRLNCVRRVDYGLGYALEDDEKNLWVCHGHNAILGTAFATDGDGDELTFKTTLKWVKKFLEDHPTETVILSIKPETTLSNANGKIMQRVKKILQEEATEFNNSTHEPFLYKEDGSTSFFTHYNHMPKLKDCRGKIVIIVQEAYVDVTGGFYLSQFVNYDDPTSDFEITRTEKLQEIPREYRQHNDGSVMIPGTAEDKLNILWDWELNCTGEDNPAWYFGYAVGPNPVESGEFINPNIIGYNRLFGKDPGQYIGIVRMDVFDRDYSEPVWRTNFFGGLQYCTVTVKSGLTDPADPTKPHPDYPDQTYKLLKGTQITIPGNIYHLLPDDRHFGTWNATWEGGEANGTDYGRGSKFTIEKDVTFTAKWLEPGKYPVSIVWQDGDDADKLRPHSVNMKVTSSDGTSSTLKVRSDDDWVAIIEGDMGKTIDDYEVVPEWDLIDITTENPGGQDTVGKYRFDSNNGGEKFAFTFYHTPQTTSKIAGNVIWDDNNDEDHKRPTSVKINLIKNGDYENPAESVTITAADGWKYSFGDRKMYENGKKVEYSITEDSLEASGYETSIDGFTVTNYHEPGSKKLTNVYGVIKWVDEENALGKRPGSVTVRLHSGDASGPEIDSQKIETNGIEIWSFRFEGLSSNASYGITIDPVDGYDSVVEGVSTTTDPNDYMITNTLIVDVDDKTDSAVEEAPKGYSLTYAGKDQTLISEGEGSGGTIMYAAVEVNLNNPSFDPFNPPSDDKFSEELPAGENVDRYAVWYYVKGDMFHNDTAKAAVMANINKRKVVITADDAFKEAGAEDPTFTGSVEGLINDNDLGTIFFQRDTIHDPNPEAAGIHTGVIWAGHTIDNSNYEVEFRNGNFTIGNLTAVWLNGDDSVLLTKTYPAGQAVPSYDGRTPVKTETSDYTYKWIGWDGGTVDGTVTTFRPLFTAVPKVKKGVLTLDAGAGTYKTVPSGFTYDAAAHKLSIVANVGDVITMPAGPVLEGYKFLYWKGSEYYPGEKYKVEGDHNFTAMWEKVKSDGPSDHHSSEITEETVHPSQNQPAVAQTPAGNAAVDKAPVTGDSAENKTTEKKGSNRSGSPDTGDESNLFWWLMMFIASFAVLIGALAYPKKK